MFSVLYGFAITLIAYLLAKPCNRVIPQIPVIVFSMFLVLVILLVLGIPYEHYMDEVNPLFNHLLGYVTVALAIPLAAMRYDDLPLKAIIGILVLPVSVRLPYRWVSPICCICLLATSWPLPPVQSQHQLQLILQPYWRHLLVWPF